MINIDTLSFLQVLVGSFILTMSAGWALLRFLDVFKRRTRIKRLESQIPTRDPVQVVSPPAIQRKIRRKQGMLRRVFAELKPYSMSIIVLLVVSLSAIPITLITPLPIKLTVDNIIGSSTLPGYVTFLLPGGLQASKDYVLWLALGILVGSTLLTYLQNLVNVWLTNKIGNRMTLDVRDRLFRQMQRLSIAYHDTKGSADSTYRTLQDAPALRSFGVDSLIPLITALLTLGAMIIVTLFLDWQLALIALLVSPFTFLLTLMFRPRLRRGWRKVKISESAAMAVAQETLGASRVVKAFGQEDQKSDQLVSRYNESLSAALKVYVYGAVYNLLVGAITAVGLAAVLYIGIRHVQSNPSTLTLGSLLVVNYYVTQLYSPLKNVGQKMLDMQMALAGVERCHAVLDEKSDVPDAPNALPISRARGKIAFQNVSFEYTPGHPVLHEVSFELLPGNCLGVVGSTGSGKTTLSNLLLRFFDPTEGVIMLDDVDLRNYKLADLRNQFAVVLQDTVLFSTTITENIRFARPGATFAEVVAAATAANAHEFINDLPNRYDTLVGERGMKLSGGQRQRISLARAFLKNAPILILDEPTSALDVNAEAAVLDAIQRLMEGRTTLMIAHRASALRNCNIILILEEGRVRGMTTEVGSVLSGMTAASLHR